MADKMKKFLDLHKSVTGGNSGNTTTSQNAPAQSYTGSAGTDGYKKQQKLTQFQAMHDQAKRSFSITGRNDGSDDFVFSFLRDSQNYIRESASALNRPNWKDAMDAAKSDNRTQVWNTLRERESQVRSFMEDNKAEIEPGKYQQIMAYLEDFDKDLDSVSKAYSDNQQYFSQWNSEEDYDWYQAYLKDLEEKRNLDLDAYGKEIELLGNALSEYKNLSRWNQDSRGNARLEAIRQKYGSLDEMESLLSQKQQYLNQAKRIQKKDSFSAVADPESEKFDSAFDSKSGYVSTEQDGKLERMLSQYSMGYGDLTYEYINNQNSIRDEIKHKASAYSKGETPFEAKGYDYMTADEVGLYNYYYSMGGKASAEAYLDTIQEDLNQRKAAGMYQQMEGKTGAEMVFGVEAGLDQFKSGIKGAVRSVKGDDSYVATSATQYASGMVREDLADDGMKLPSWLGGASLGQVGYDAITTTANMAPSIAVGMLNPTLGTAALGVSAGGSAYQEALNEGYSVDQARGYGILSGASEIVMEKVLGGISAYGGNALGKFFTQNMKNADTALKRIAKELGGSMLSEFREEYLQEVLTPVFRNLTLGTDEEVQLVSAEALYAGFLGAITGGIMEGPSAVTRNATQTPSNATELAKNASPELSKATVTEENSTPSGVTDPPAAVGDKMKATEVGVSKMEQPIQMTGDIESFSAQFGKQAEAVKRNYLEGQDLQEYEVGFQTAYAMGKEGSKPENLTQKNVPYLTQSQREIAYRMGQEAAAAQKAAPAAVPDSAIRAVQISTGKPVEIAKISNVNGNGGMTFRLSDGRTVEASDIQYGTESEAVLYESVADLGASAEVSNKLVNTWRENPGGVSAETYAAGMMEAFNYGRYNIPETEMEQSETIQPLTVAQRSTAYQLGKTHGSELVQTKEANIRRAGALAKAQKASRMAAQQTVTATSADNSRITATGAGKVHFDRQGRTLSTVQETGLKTMEQLSQLFGTEFHVFESYEKDGKRVFRDENGVERDAPNGWYDPETGHIHIDLNAGSGGRGTMLFTVAHELTHYIRDWSPAKFDKLAEAVFELVYKEKNIRVVDLVRKQQAKAARNGMELSFDEAYEEVVADSMESILTSGNVVELMAEVKQQDQSLWQKIRKWFQNLAEDIRKMIDAYAGYKPDSAEGRAVAAMQDVLPILEGFYMDALQEASGNYQAAARQKNTTQEGGRKNSFAGRGSVTADRSALQQAEQLAEEGMDNETIRQQTGWYKGMDGQWRYEIDDSQMEITNDIINYMQLGELIQHEKLFAAYPDLADIDVVFQSLDTGVNGSYHPQFDSINLSYKLKNDPIGLKDALVHEIQHAIQHREGFTNGATAASWERKIKAGFDSRRAADIRKAQETERELRRIQKEEPEFYRDMVELDAMTPDLPRGEIDWETLEKIEDDPVEWQQYDARREELEAKYGDTKVWDMNDLLYQREQAAKNVGRSGVELYFDTAGEIEARDASNRRSKSPEQRKTSPPRLGNEDTVFAEGNAPADDYIPGTVSEKEIADNINAIAEMESVVSIKGDEFKMGDGRLLTDVTAFFESIGGSVYNKRLGDVYLRKRGVRHDLGHGMSDEKAASFAAIPAVLEHGQVAGFVVNKGGKGFDSAPVVAPITIGNEPYMMGVIVHRSNKENRFYVHDVVAIKEEAAPLITGTHNVGETGGATSTISIIRKILSVKANQMESGKKFSHRDATYTSDDIARLEAELSEVAQLRQEAQTRYEQLKSDPALVEAETRLTEIRNSGGSRLAVIRTPEYKAARQDRDAIKTRLGIEDAMEQMYDLMDRERYIRKELDSATEYVKSENARKVEQKAVAESGMSEADYFRNRAEQTFGITKEFKYAGYLLPDGKMLDFTSPEGKRDGKRDKDHREIADIYEYTQQSAALLRFLNDGNIRIMAETPGIDISESREPTAAQYAEIKRFVREYTRNRLFVVDISGQNDSRVGTYTYEGRVNADRVVNDIKYYFQNGSLREQSTVASFHYSQRDPLQEKAVKALEKENAQLKEDVSRLRELVKLQGKVTNGTRFKRSSVEAVAIYLKKLFRTGGDTKELVDKLKDFYEYMASESELTLETVQEQAAPIIEWLQENEKFQRSQYAQEVLDTLKGQSFYLDETQQQEAASQYGNLANYRRAVKNMVSGKAGQSLDQLWHELSGQYPDIFRPDTNASDMPLMFADVLDMLENMGDTETTADWMMKDQTMLEELLDSFWRVDRLATVADRYEKKINELRWKHEKQMKQLRRDRDSALAELRADKKAAVATVRDNRDRATIRGKIRKTMRKLDMLLKSETKEKHVPDSMKKAVADALSLMNDIEIGTAEKRMSALQHEIRNLKRKLEQAEGLGDRELTEEFRAQLDEKELALQRYEKSGGRLTALRDAYADIRNSADPDIAAGYDAEVAGALAELADSIKDTSFRDMSKEQLQDVLDMYTMVLTRIRDANKQLGARRGETLQENAAETEADIRKFGISEKDPGVVADKLGKLVRGFSWNNLRPVDAFHRLGSKKLEQLYMDLADGMAQRGRQIKEIGQFITDIRKKTGYKSFDLKEAETYTTVDGKEMKLTLAEKMSIYAYSKRDQAYDHMAEGGFTYAKDLTYKENGKTKVHTGKAKTWRISMEDLQAICGSLTEKQRQYVDAVQQFLTEFGIYGDKVNMELYGIKLFNKEKAYFPLQSDRDYRKSVENQLGGTMTAASLKSDGMTKKTVPGANNPIILEDFDRVVFRHLDKMVNYANLVLPLENLRRVFDYQTSASENQAPTSMKALIGATFGREAQQYVEQFLTDANGTRMSMGVQNPLEIMFTRSKGMAVAANLSVMIQQISAVVRAGAEISPKHLIWAAESRKGVKLYDEMVKYAPITIIKDMGGFDTGSNRSLEDYIGFEEAPNSAKKVWNSMQKLFGMGAETMDKVGWCLIWNGVKREVASRKQYEVNSEEFLQECGRRFTEVIVKTQVYDSVLSRSGYMRDKHGTMRYLTSFMGEPTVQAGMVFNSHLDVVRAIQHKKNIRYNVMKLVRTDAALVGALVVNGMLKAIPYAMRDDDEDEGYWERWAKQFGAALSELWKPWELLPILRNIDDLASGRTIEQPDMALLSDLLQVGTKVIHVMQDEEAMADMKPDDWYALAKELAGSVGNLLGVPVKNIWRDAEGYVRIWKDATDGIDSDGMLLDALWRGVKGEEKTKHEGIYDAMISGDTARLNALKSTYKTDGSYESAVRKALRLHDPRIKEMANARYEGDYDRLEELSYEIEAEGIFDMATIRAAYEAERTAQAKERGITLEEDSAAEQGEESTVFSMEEYYAAIRSGSKDNIQTAYNALIEEKKQEYYLEREAEDSIASSVTSKVKGEYLDEDISRADAKSILTKYGGKSKAEAETEIKKWEFQMEYHYAWGSRDRCYRSGTITRSQLVSAVMDIEDASREEAQEYVDFLELEMKNENVDITASEASSYFEHAKPHGISVDVYLDYKARTKGIQNDKDANGDSIPYTAVQKIMTEIDKLPISSNQKYALARSNGWAEKTIQKYKKW